MARKGIKVCHGNTEDTEKEGNKNSVEIRFSVAIKKTGFSRGNTEGTEKKAIKKIGFSHGNTEDTEKGGIKIACKSVSPWQ